MYASYLGHADTCEVLLKQLRVNVNDTNQMGQTALMLAASCGSAATVIPPPGYTLCNAFFF